MSDWKLHERAYQDHRDEMVDGYVAAQRQAFLDGFEAAATEAEEFAQLRDWLEGERDKCAERYEETEEPIFLAMQQAYIDVLVKLSEVGCRPDE